MEQFNFGPAKTQISTATQSSDGLMSLSDKTKLDGIESGATANVVSDSLSDTSTTNALSAAKGKALNDGLTSANAAIANYNFGSKTVADFKASLITYASSMSYRSYHHISVEISAATDGFVASTYVGVIEKTSSDTRFIVTLHNAYDPAPADMTLIYKDGTWTNAAIADIHYLGRATNADTVHNNAKNNSFYRTVLSSNSTNAPTTHACWLEGNRISDNYGMQFATDTETGIKYGRYKWSLQWSNWQSLALGGHTVIAQKSTTSSSISKNTWINDQFNLPTVPSTLERALFTIYVGSGSIWGNFIKRSSDQKIYCTIDIASDAGVYISGIV